MREDVIHTKIFTVTDLFFLDREAVTQKCSEKNICLEISENSQEMQPETWNFFKKEALTQVFSCEFWEISKNTFPYRTFRVVASAYMIFLLCKVTDRSSASHVFHIEETLCEFQKIPRENIWDDAQYLQSSSLQVFVALCCRGLNGNFSKIIKVAISENISGRLIPSNK